MMKNIIVILFVLTSYHGGVSHNDYSNVFQKVWPNTVIRARYNLCMQFLLNQFG